jgi:hypothetical protein
MARQGAKPYVFVGTERELVDPPRYERAMRAWSGYLLDRLAAERAARRDPRSHTKVS